MTGGHYILTVQFFLHGAKPDHVRQYENPFSALPPQNQRFESLPRDAKDQTSQSETSKRFDGLEVNIDEVGVASSRSFSLFLEKTGHPIRYLDIVPFHLEVHAASGRSGIFNRRFPHLQCCNCIDGPISLDVVEIFYQKINGARMNGWISDVVK